MGDENRIAVALDDPRLQYTGRIDRSDPKHPEFVFPATSLRFRFRGERAYLAVTNRRQYWTSSGQGLTAGARSGRCFRCARTGKR